MKNPRNNQTNMPLRCGSKSLINMMPGKCPVYVEVITDNNMRVIVQIDGGVRPHADFLRRLEAMVGRDHYRLLRPHDRIALPEPTAV